MHLDSKISEHWRLDAGHKKGLEKLGIQTIRDLLYHFPSRYGDISALMRASDISGGEVATLYGRISSPKTKKSFRGRMPMGEAYLDDGTAKIKLVWFHQPYIAKMINEGDMVKVTGKVSSGKSGLSITNPEFEKVPDLPIDRHDSLFHDSAEKDAFGYPVYAETRGVTSKWFYHGVLKVFNSGILNDTLDPIPKEILEQYHLPSLATALVWIHTPKKEEHSKAARKRFAFEEIFFIQLKKQKERKEYRSKKSYPVHIDPKSLGDFLGRFSFKPTGAQTLAISDILNDLKKDAPMFRLLEGDVGSGKTLVAAAAAYATVQNRPPSTNAQGKQTVQTFGNLQVAFMAPTEILATQHFESFIPYFSHLPIQIALITGSGCRKFPSKVPSRDGGVSWTNISKPQLLKWVKNGEVPIVIGTHALIQKSIEFKHLALAIIDEQHRFGTKQREKITKKESAPHLLSMTATPIPRTLALTIYGDLDLTLLDEVPPGRKQTITEIITPDKRAIAYDKIKKEMAEGRQLYVICPRINEPDPEKEISINMKSVVSEALRLKKEVFPDKNIGVLHSKLSKEKKEEVMERFVAGEYDILVSTSVIEVGVNVPNATIIIIEGAERFGLAQLHQLRGRVQRSTHQPYCYIFAEAKTQKTMDRLKAIVTAKNGFELSELDLALRGAGELSGGKQWGISDLGMEAIKNIKMVEAARKEATEIIEKDPSLSHYPDLLKTLEHKKFEIHFE